MFYLNKNINQDYNVAIYIRLSKEDEKEGHDIESESIQNQKLLLTKYVEEQNYTLVDIYIDDGYTGTNFNRPAFKRMLKDIEKGKINMVITKDLSRLSRDYIGTGEYVEKWFPKHNVRYIALTDAIDTAIDSANNDIAPFKAILNDMYAKDLSKKIRTALHTMQIEGKWVGGCPPYGYKVDPKDKNHLVIDKNEGPVITRIFNMFYNGFGINEIRDTLNNENVPTFSLTRNRNLKQVGNASPILGLWHATTIKRILKNRLYVGDMVQNRRCRVSYKFRKIINNPASNWIIVKNTHEALIDRKIFDDIQIRLPNQIERNDKKNFYLLDGLIKCADCNHNIGIKSRDKKTGKTYTVCNYYRKYKAKYKMCTSHGTDYDKLEGQILNIIKSILSTIDPNKIIPLINTKLNHKPNDKKRDINKLTKDIEVLKSSLDNMYLEKLASKITEEMYNRINIKINKSINEKENKINEINNNLNKNKTQDLKSIITSYLNLEYPTRDLILKLINHISMHEDGNIDIYFNFKEPN